MPWSSDLDEDEVRKQERTARGVRPDKSLEVDYRGYLLRINRTIDDEIISLGKMIQAGLINQADSLIRLRQFEERLISRVRGDSPGIASKVIQTASGTNKERLQNLFKRTFSIDIFQIIDEKGLREQLDGMIQENISLINSLPGNVLDEVKRSVVANFRGESLPSGGSLVQDLRRIGSKYDSYSRRIARDQTSKLNASINQVRQQSIGIEEYFWRTNRDLAVVGFPGGLYPEGNKKHGNHWKREGKKFRWDNPPSDGHPGVPIQCRCHADPVIDIDKIMKSRV